MHDIQSSDQRSERDILCEQKYKLKKGSFFFEQEGGKRSQEIKSELLVVALVGCLSSKLEPVLCSAHFKVYLLTRFFPRQKE